MSPMPRPVRVIAVFASATVAALTGCSSGQVTQTARQESTINGASADVGDLALRDVRILFPTSGTYTEGGTARLAMAVVNRGLEDDRLIEMTGDFFELAIVSDKAAGASRDADEPSVEAAIPREGTVLFGTDDSPAIELDELTEELTPAQVVSITFVFERAGEVTVEVPVANPTRPVEPGETFDFHPDEH